MCLLINVLDFLAYEVLRGLKIQIFSLAEIIFSTLINKIVFIKIF